MTATPGSSTWAGTRTRFVISRSEPTSSIPSASAVIRRSVSTGSAPERLATARCTVATASARVSRSQWNFTADLLSFARKGLVVFLGPVDCALHNVSAGHRPIPLCTAVPNRPQASTRLRQTWSVLPQFSGDIPQLSTALSTVDPSRDHPRAPCLIRLMSSLTWSNTSSFSASWPRIFSHACMTVVWSRPPNTSAIFG